jgi:hypothetical protein
MIQRIQSIFLLIAGAGFFSLFSLPFAKSSETAVPLFEDQLFNIQDNPVLLGLCVAGGIISTVTIFLFKNRILQKRLALLGAIFAIGLGGFALYTMTSETEAMASTVEVSNQAGLFIPAVSVVMLMLSNIFINKDEKLVRSSDRLR